MAATGASTSWGEYLKYIQGTLENLMNDHAYLQKRIAFDVARREGRKFIYPVILRGPHGVTHAHTGTAKKTDYTLNEPRSSVVQEAELDAKEYTLQEDIASGLLKSAMGGSQSDGTIVDQTLALMQTSAQFYLEMELLHGADATGGIGVVESAADVSAGNVGSIVITKASWAAGLWPEMENALVDIYSADGTTRRNTAGTCYVTAVDPNTRTISLAGTEAELDTIIATDVVMPAGWYGATIASGTINCFAGLKTIASHASGELFGISATTYGKWLGNTKTLSSTKATMASVLQARRQAAARGAKGDFDVLLSEWTWEDINNDTAALRRFAEDTKQGVSLGTQNIQFYSSGGVITLVPHPLVKAGQMIGYSPKTMKRIGASEPQMEWPSDDPMHLESKKAVRFRLGYSQALLPVRGPGSCFYMSGIVNESL